MHQRVNCQWKLRTHLQYADKWTALLELVPIQSLIFVFDRCELIRPVGLVSACFLCAAFLCFVQEARRDFRERDNSLCSKLFSPLLHFNIRFSMCKHANCNNYGAEWI